MPNPILDKYNHIIFAFEYTIAMPLMDRGGWHKGLAEIFKKYDSTYAETWGERKVFYGMINRYIRKHGDGLLREVVSFTQRYERENVREYQPDKNVLDMIPQLQTQQLYLWSSFSRATVERGLNAVGLSHRFNKIVTREDVRFIMPDEEGFEHIKDPSVSANRYILVGGNTAADGAAAHSAGIAYINIEELFPQKPKRRF